MPTSREVCKSAVVNNKIYVIGGLVWDPNDRAINVNEEYDPASDSWTTKKPMPTARLSMAVSVVDGIIYVMGGQSGPGSWCNTVEAYDPVTDSWTKKASILTGRTHFSSAEVNGIIYAIGGGTTPSTILSTVEAYDPINDIWTTKMDMPTPRIDFGIGSVKGKIYVIGGNQGWAAPGLSTVEEYDPSKDLTGIVKNVNISKSYAVPGNDSVCVTAKLNNPTGITIIAEIEALDQTIVDSLHLYDDGNHNDGNAGDSLYANIWPILPVDERNYYVDLKVTRIDADTVVNHFDNMAVFTTIGPVQAAESPAIDYYYEERYKRQYFLLVLQNKGAVATAVNLKAKISSADPRIKSIFHHTRSFPDLAAGEIDTSSISKYYSFDYADGFTPDSTFNNPIHFNLTVFSNGYPFWISTFDYVADTIMTAIEDNFNNIPKQFALHQNYPNPFNPETSIRYSASKPARVMLRIMNLLDQEVRTLVNEEKPVGCYEVTWDGKDDHGQRVASGVYLYRLGSRDFVQTRKMIFLK